MRCLHQVFICVAHVFPLLLQLWDGIKTNQELATHVFLLLKFRRWALKEDVPVQNQLHGWEDVERVMHLHGLSYIPEIIKTELTTKKTRELVAKKYYGDLQLLLIPIHHWLAYKNDTLQAGADNN